MTDPKLISVIVPIYNTEKYINRCIVSIEKNSYKNIEVIIVNDGSTDSSPTIIKQLAEKYSNIKIINHEKNMGLFQARITGFEASKGDYIAFVDADDYVSVDWFRLLYQTSIDNNSDITIGQFLFDNNSVVKSYNNLNPTAQNIYLYDENVIKTFIHQQGLHYSWQLVWNKLYTRKLWEMAISDLNIFAKNNPNLTMCEDLIFSTALWIRAKIVCNFKTGAEYFYFVNDNQSTKVCSDKTKNIEKINNVASALNFIDDQLKKFKKYEQFKEDTKKWRINYAQIYYRDLSKFDENFYKEYISIKFNVDPILFINRPQLMDYFFSKTTTIKENIFSWYSVIKEMICDPAITVISFDIFDTLILRPFYFPTDLFYFLNNFFIKTFNVHAFFDFAQIRISEEQRCREINKINNPLLEEITLDQIYEIIANDYGFDPKKLDLIKNKEIELEENFCYVRKFGKQLFDLAKQQGKKVICTSDMYLPKKVVENILKKNGYDCDELFLSSDIGLGKYTGNLFNFITKKYNIKPDSFLHIGDNWNSDVELPHKYGWRSHHIPKPVDIYQRNHPIIYGGNLMSEQLSHSGLMDLNCANLGFIGLRCFNAIIANKLYDNPYCQTNIESDYNMDPFNIGYAALGPYLYAVTDWIINNTPDTTKTIHFVARDGYLPMLAYNIFKKYCKNLKETNYLYVSRKSMISADIYCKEDIYSLTNKMNLFNYSPKKLFDIFKVFFKKKYKNITIDKFCALLDLPKNLIEKNFDSKLSFEKFLNNLNNLISDDSLMQNQEKLRSYFSSLISKNDILFDIGYSGRQEVVLSQLLGFPINSLYIHSNSDILNTRAAMGNFTTKLFYNYKPKITGVIREHVFMKLAPSVVGYKEKANTLEPLFEENKINVQTEIITNTLQNAALEFVNDILSIFGEYKDNLYYRKDDLAFNFEYYLLYSKPIDRDVFKCLEFEDDMGLGKSVNAVDFWNNDLKNFGLYVNQTQQIYSLPKKIENPTIPQPKKRKIVDFFLPRGTKRREFFRKIYIKFKHKK